MAVWVRPDHRTDETVFRTVQDRVLKVSIWAGFGSGLLENVCWTLLWPVFGPFMTSFEVGFDSERCCPVFSLRPHDCVLVITWPSLV